MAITLSIHYLSFYVMADFDAAVLTPKRQLQLQIQQLHIQNQQLLAQLHPLETYDVGIRGWGPRVWRGWEEGYAGMETVVCEERGEGGSRGFGIVVAEFCQGEEAGPVGLLIVAVDSKVLLQD